MKLLVIADDFTGALDTGIQFKAKDTLIQVLSGEKEMDIEALPGRVQVLIIDAETRHLTAERAGEVVGRIVREAVRAGIPYIYKKIDSGLRGNIGSELSAMLEASGEKRVHFAPAFPRLNRVTRQGVHYIDGIPVARSVFGSDPFEPVLDSDVRRIIAAQSKVPVFVSEAGVPDELPEGIVAYDASTQDELDAIAGALKDRGELRLMSGCAGFAASVQEQMGLIPDQRPVPELEKRLLVVCGSINPITLDQLDEAQRLGALRLQLGIDQKLDAAWPDSALAKETAQSWARQIGESTFPVSIIEGNRHGEEEETLRYAKRHGMDTDAVRDHIAAALGSMLEHLLTEGVNASILLTGGDTLLAFMKRIGQSTLIPIREVMPGVVLSEVCYRGKSYSVFSKSGGFGEKDLLLRLQEKLERQTGCP